jgi:hypothetical protein
LVDGGTPQILTPLTLLTRLNGNHVATDFQTVSTPVIVSTHVREALRAETTSCLSSDRDNLPSRIHPRQILLPSPTRSSGPVKICNRQDSAELDANYTRVVGASVFWGLISANKGSTTDTTVFNQVYIL